MFERFTDSARDAVVHAQDEARQLDHDRIGTEHILLALLRGRDTVAARALESLGVSIDAVREQVQAASVSSGSPDTHLPFTPRGKKVLELALREALQLHHNSIASEHILLGIVRDGGGAAVRILERLGAQVDDVRAAVMGLLPDTPDERPIGAATPIERRVSATMGFSMSMAAEQTGDDPRCARCNADVSENLRARSVAVTLESAEPTPGWVTLLWCGVCGGVLGVVPASLG